MHPEAEAEVVLIEGAAVPASPVASYGFIATFGEQSYSAAVLPDGTAHLLPQQNTQVRLKFRVEAAASVLHPEAKFEFFEQGRRGQGRILRRL